MLAPRQPKERKSLVSVAAKRHPVVARLDGRQKSGADKLAAIGSLFGAVGAASCCILPLVLFAAGVGGAWIGALTALQPYQPIFVAVALGFLGHGYWLAYRRRKVACADAQVCARPLPNRLVRTSLYTATMLVVAAVAFPYVAPLFLGV